MVKIRICTEPGCNNAQTTRGFCRLHYLKNWKTIKKEKQKAAAGRLNKFIEDIVAKHPDRYIEIIKKEIKSKQLEKTGQDEFTNDLDDVYKVFNDPGFEGDIEKLIRDLKYEDEF